ncbi:MAG: tripartite tricarboxylate transporter substrate binding protein [Pseudomonadota bacterium]
MNKKISRRAVMAGLSAFAAVPAVAQPAPWPNRPITLTHGFGAGGNADVVGRLVAERLGARLGQQIVVDPKPGAGGTTAASLLARSAPDGYTLGILPGGHAIAAAIYKKLPYKPVEDYSLISMLTDFPFVLVTYPDHPVSTVADLIEKARTETLTCASPGNGTGQHLAFELFASMAKVKMQHVPYRGSPQAATDLMGKRIDFWMDTPTAMLELIKDNKLRAVATTGTEPFFALPATPTAASAGVTGYSVTSWLGIAGPAGLPADMLKRLNTEVHAVLSEPQTIERLRALGSMTKPTTPHQFADRIGSDIAKWSAVVEAANIERI